MHPSLHIYNTAVKDFIQTDFDIQLLTEDCSFTEGPVWNEAGFYLFSDITANVIYKLVPGREKEIFLLQSGTKQPNAVDLQPTQAGSNGLAYFTSKELLVCRHGSHGIAKVVEENLLPYIDEYNGRPFNSPNDLVCDAKGRVFFSDPPYGLKDGKLNVNKFQPIAGVYCFDGGEVKLICDRYQYPNGICLTADGEGLLICSNKPFEKFISLYDLESLRFTTVVATENSDGIKCDPHGNIYLCNKEGLLILSSTGERLARITLPTIPANICWGGPHLKDLFVTARENVFLIPNLLK